MIKKLIFVLFLCAIPTFGQSTTVSATVTDTSGQAWNSGTYSFGFYPAPTNPQGPYIWTGGPFNPSQPISGPLSTSGTFSVSIPDNHTITPSGSQWTVTVCPAASTSQCYAKTLVITGATMNISSVLIPPPPQVTSAVTSQLSAYRDSEIVNPILGTTYFNLIDNTVHVCTGPALPCTWVPIGGGSAANPASPACALQLSNQSVTAFATSTVGGITLGLNSCTSPTQLTVPYSLATIGPRPTVDVTAWGADPTGVTDSTTTIQNAFNFACSNGGGITFPQGKYKVTQNQSGSSSINPIFTIPIGCQGTANGVFIQGIGSGYQSGQQFAIPPMSQISVTAGATPSMGPIFNFGQNQFNNRVTGLNLQCYNQCISSYGTAGLWMDHISTSVQNTGQGVQHGASFMADNVGVAIYDTFWVGCDYCNLDGYANNTTLPMLLLAGVTPLSGGRNVSGIWISTGGIWESGNILYDQRVSAAAAGGNINIKNLTIEQPGNNLPIMQVSSSSFMDFGPVYMNNVEESDVSSAPVAAIQLSANAIYTDFVLDNVYTSAYNPAIQITSGSMLGCSIRGAAGMNRGMVNASGQLVAGCTGANDFGFDMVSAPNDTGPNTAFYNTNMYYGPGFFGSNNTATPIRMATNTSQYSSLGISPSAGVVFGPGSASGYDAEVYRPSLQAIALRMAQTTAPTGLGVSLAAGGVLGVAIPYYYFVEANTAASTCLASNSTGPSAEVTITPTLGSQTANLTWTPVTTGAGYCVWRGTSSQGENVFFWVSGASSTGFSDTGTVGTSGTPSFVNQSFPSTAQWIFSPTGLTLNGCVSGTYVKADGTGCGNAGIATFQVNGTPLLSSNVINFLNSASFNGVTFTETNTSLGNIQLGATGTFTNAALANPFTTVNGQTCTLGLTCNVPFQTNGVTNSSLGGVNFSTSTTNAVGLIVTPTNPGTNQETFEITGGTYTGTASALGATPTDCSGGQFATGIAANGNAICATPGGAGNFLVSGGAQYDIATFSGATTGIGIVPGTAGYALVSNGASAYPTFQQISLTTGAGQGVIGLLPNANLANPSTTVNLATCTLGSSCTANPIIAVTNAGSTGTTLNTLTKVTGAPSTAVIGAITDTSSMVGITVSGAGTTGTATIQTTGQVSCVFSNSTTAGDYVQISPTVAGNCADTGSSTPPGGYSVGRVLSTNGSAGTYQIDLALGTGSSGGSSSFTGMTTNGVAYATSTTGGTSSGAPSINGQYTFGVTVTGGVSTPPGFALVSLTGPTTLTGSVNSYTTTYADNSSVIPHYFASTVSVTLNLSTPTTVLNSFPVYSYSNHSTHIDTIAPAGGFTIQSGNSAAASSINVSPGVECRIMIDPLNPTTNWLADCRPNGGFSTIGFASVTGGTGAGAYLISNSLAPTGAGTVEATQMWNVIGSSTPPSIGQCWVASSATAAGWSGCTGSLAFPLTVSGTVNSGGIPGFTSTTTMASSALLALGHVMLGGGAGATPTTDANLDDGQTFLNQLTYAGTAGIKASQGPLVAGLNGGVSQPFVLQQGTAPPSSGAQDRCYGDSTFNWILCSMNNGTYNQMVVSSSTSSTSGDLATYSGIGGNTVQDSTIPGTNLVLSATPATSAKQVCTATANSSKTCSYIDIPEVFEFPTANVNGSNAGNGWSINTTCGPLPAIYARTGTNLATGYLQFSASESACTQFELPADWDTATNPYIRVNYTQNASTASQSIIYTIQVGCSATTDDAAFATAQTFSTTTTGATANTPYTQTLQLNSTSMTACAGGSMMNLKVSTAAGSSAATNLQMVSLTVPRLITVQAN